MHGSTSRGVVSAAIAVGLIAAGLGAHGAAASSPRVSSTGGPAAAYCVATGGAVETRYPFYGTNGPVKSWLRLAGKRMFCQYTAKDGSRIHVLLGTLYTTKPSLAALAYYAKVKPNPPGPGNPASYYCTQLGGSDQFGGTTGAGGGWVEPGKGVIDRVLQACIFPDMSSIDSWGLLYHAVGIIRGIDLGTVLRYHQ